MSDDTPHIEVQAVSAPPSGDGAAHATAVETPKPPPLVEPLRVGSLSGGWMQKVDQVLHRPEALLEAIRAQEDLWGLARFLFVVTVFAGAAYGVVMGATNWLQGSPFHFGWEFLMMIATGLKVPVLFLLTLAIVTPPIYISSTFIGVRASFGQVVALLLAAMAVTAVALASMASVAFFFALTTRSYTFMKLLHVAVFTYAGILGLACLTHWFRTLFGGRESGPRRFVLLTWLILYMFVGTQLAWVLRPFVGSPDIRYTLFRPVESNFYEDVYDSLTKLLSE